MHAVPRLLISDMDHTLLREDSSISRANLEAIARHVAGGGLFTVASGRAPAAIRAFPELLPYLNAPVIAGNGGLVCDLHTGEIFYRHPLPAGLERLVAELMERFPEMGAAVYSGLDGFYALRTNANIEDLMAREKRPALPATVETAERPWNKVLLTQTHAYMLEVEAFLRPRVEGLARIVFSEDTYLEILPLEVSKGAALKLLLERIGVPREQVVALGDAMNDLEMLHYAGAGVAVSNADPALRAAADFVVCSNEEDAVRACLERFFGR